MAIDQSDPFAAKAELPAETETNASADGRGLKVHALPLWASTAYLLEADEGLVLVDAGMPYLATRIVRRIHSIGRDTQELRLIYITHAHIDHYGSAAVLREISGAPIAIHQDDADNLAEGRTELGMIRDWKSLSARMLPWLERLLKVEPTVADIIVKEGGRLDDYGLDAAVLHTPGHTPGSSVLLVEDRLAFVGDLVSMTGRPHAQRSYADNWQQVAESLARVQGANPQLVYAGHGTQPLRGEVFQELRVSLAGEGPVHPGENR